MWKDLPEKNSLLGLADPNEPPLKVNAHLHSPYSFSAFKGIDHALNMALKENVKVVGINDFFTTEGFAEWAKGCEVRKLFPLFNIKLISISKPEQEAGIVVNDPGNPGRVILSGKGLAFTPGSNGQYKSQLNAMRQESNRHAARVCASLNCALAKYKMGFDISYTEVERSLTWGNVRDQHLAKALREKLELKHKNPDARKTALERLLGGKPIQSAMDDYGALENEVLVNLLKENGEAFVPEDPKAFADIRDIHGLILNAGGIPTYYFLGDNANGAYTGFEEDKKNVAANLKQQNIWSVEFIANRNSPEMLEEYASYFYDNGFVVTLGSEHSTSQIQPIEVFDRNSTPLSHSLASINYKGACVLAAHQYLVATDGKGYLDNNGKADLSRLYYYEALGDGIIRYFVRKKL